MLSPVKLHSGFCHLGCGREIQYRTNARVICEVCKPAHRAEQARRVAERQRRKRGVAPVKGTDFDCSRCGGSFVRTNINAKFCSACAPLVVLERARERVNRLSRERGAAKVGEITSCKHCAAPFTREAARECYCADCKELQRLGKLPHLKQAQKRYYREVIKPRYRSDPEFIAKTKRQQAESRERRKVDPAFSINERMSAGVRYSIGRKKNGSSWEALVGYTCTELMTHLERQFLKGMTWENRGKWEIDHIVPVAAHSFTSPEDPEFRACWALTNLRPLWREANNEKRAKRTHLI